MIKASAGEAAGDFPGLSRGIIEFRAGKQSAVTNSRSDQNLAIGEQACRETNARVGQRPGFGPETGRRIVKLRAAEKNATVFRGPGHNQYLAVRQQRRPVAKPAPD